MTRYSAPVLLALALALSSVPSSAEGVTDSLSAEQQFEQIRSWEGRWQVAETPALTIVFEKTARGTAMVERWETSAGLHSMTIYHMDGDALVATHYCPQGNQPRLESHGGDTREIRFTFRDVTDWDEGESHTHDLWFTPGENGTIRRSEVYLGAKGLQEPGNYTLSRATEAE